jgi:hypothetical protein
LQNEEVNKALDAFTEALQLARETGNAEGIFTVSRDLGGLLCRMDQKEAGIPLLKQAVAVGKTMERPDVEEIEKLFKEYE